MGLSVCILNPYKLFGLLEYMFCLLSSAQELEDEILWTVSGGENHTRTTLLWVEAAVTFSSESMHSFLTGIRPILFFFNPVTDTRLRTGVENMS